MSERNTIYIYLYPDAEPEKLAIDTHLKILFYTDYGQSIIAKIDYFGNNMTTILDASNDLQYPAGIAADTETR